MLQSLKQIKSRIRSIASTKKLTRAMEMVSVAKLKRHERMMGGLKEYASGLELLLQKVVSAASDLHHPYFEKKNSSGGILCLVTSDTGLCSTYNTMAIRAAENFVKSHPDKRFRLVAVGKKGLGYFQKRGYDIAASFSGFYGRYSHEISDRIFEALKESFEASDVSEVDVVAMRVKNAASREAVIEKIFPLEVPVLKRLDYLAEPGVQDILNALAPVYTRTRFRSLLLNAFLSEHQARAMAMGEATQNALELEEGLILLRNKVRQANITRELIEVVSAAEALKG